MDLGRTRMIRSLLVILTVVFHFTLAYCIIDSYKYIAEYGIQYYCLVVLWWLGLIVDKIDDYVELTQREE